MPDYVNDDQYQRWKEHRAQERDDVEREFKDAIATNDKETKKYSRDEAEQRVKDCFSAFSYPGEPVDVLIFRKGNNGDVAEMYNIFDIHEALQQLDEKKLLEKYADEGPGSDELRKSIDANNFGVKQEHEKAKSGLRRYSHGEEEKRVRDCFASTLPEHLAIFPTTGDETKELAKYQPHLQYPRHLQSSAENVHLLYTL